MIWGKFCGLGFSHILRLCYRNRFYNENIFMCFYSSQPIGRCSIWHGCYHWLSHWSASKVMNSSFNAIGDINKKILCFTPKLYNMKFLVSRRDINDMKIVKFKFFFSFFMLQSHHLLGLQPRYFICDFMLKIASINNRGFMSFSPPTFLHQWWFYQAKNISLTTMRTHIGKHIHVHKFYGK